MMAKSSFLIIIALSFMVTGCLNYTQITTIKTDNSGEMFVHYWSHWNTEQDSILLIKQEAFKKASIKSNFDCSSNKIQSIDVYTDDTDSTIHGKISFTFTDFDSLKFARAFKNMKFSISEGEGSTKIFRQSLPSAIAGFSKDDTFQFHITYYLPGKIIEHNASSQSRNKLIWNLTSKEFSKIQELNAVYIPFRLKETPRIIYILTFIIILIVLFYLVKKKKK